VAKFADLELALFYKLISSVAASGLDAVCAIGMWCCVAFEIGQTGVGSFHQTFDCVAQIFLVQLHPQCRLRMQSFFGCGQHGAGASLVFQLSVPQKAESLGRDVRSVKRINQA
jgi:hypothetical protein